MKAIRIHQYGDASTLKLEEVPSLSIADDQILVRVSRCGCKSNRLEDPAGLSQECNAGNISNDSGKGLRRRSFPTRQVG
jgi:hypothetical protein